MSEQKVGRYQLIAELGRGGMATVFRAFDPLVKRDVALKLLPREFLYNPAFRTRFQQEAQTIAALEHPSIVPVYDYGEEDGQPFLVMRLMTGGSLSERLKNGALPLPEVSRIIEEIAPGLDQAHAIGIIHRDLKPANILFDSYNNPHISDFGLVKLAESTTNLTSSGIVGTPKYMAPEMTDPKKVTRLVDIYALGVTIFEMATGQAPFEAETPVAVLMAHLKDPVPEVRDLMPGLPARLQEIVERSMAKDPQNRYQSAADLAADLDSLTSVNKTGRLSEMRHDATSLLGKADIPRRKTGGIPLGLLAGAGALVVLAGLAIGLWFGGVFGGTITPTAAPTQAQTGNAAILPVVTTEASPTLAGALTEPPTTETTEVPTAGPAATPAEKIVADTLREIVPIYKLKGHQNIIQDVAFSPDSSILASSSADHTLILWNPRTGEMLKQLTGHGDQVHGIAWSPDGKRLVSASSDDTATIWNVDTGLPAGNSLRPGNYGLSDVAWSPDGRTIAVAPFYVNLILWDLRTDQIVGQFKGHVDWINSVDYSPDGKFIASADRTGRAFIWDAVSGDHLRMLVNYYGQINQIAWSPDGKRIAGSTANKIVLVWDAETGRIALTLREHTDVVNAVAWSPDGTLLAAGGLDHNIIVYDGNTGDVLRRIDSGGGTIIRLAFSPDQTMLAVGTENWTVSVWGFAR